MSLLPGLKLVTSRWLLATSLFLLAASSAFAATSPDPRPCEDALYTDKFTKVVLEPKEHTFTVTGADGELVTLEHDFEVEVDFSELTAIFASSNSNYLEGKFQSDKHRFANITDLSSQDFVSYHGPGQEAAPKVLVDDLKENYVEYVYNKPTLAESNNKYTDIEGQGDPKTIYDLVTELGLPDPPQADEDRSDWLATWGRYWEKIPTAVDEFYYGIFRFPLVVGQKELEKVKKGNCPRSRAVYFVMPQYFRPTSIANQLNQMMVPKAAQSSSNKFVEENLLASAVNNAKAVLAEIAQNCLSFFADNPLATSLKKVIKISLNFPTPVKNAYAAVSIPPDPFPEKCPAPIPLLPNDKEGQGPFCSLPEFKPCIGESPCTLERQLEPGESCTNVDSPDKLDDGSLVKCIFKAQHFRTTLVINNPGWDCEQLPDGQYRCQLTIWVFPTFYIPWLAPIWNNTTYSDGADQIAVFNTNQETGKPGVYTFFKPNSVDFNVFPNGKNLPSKEQQAADDIKQRFFGATDCNKEFTRDIALKPKALQQHLGIKAGCEAK